MFKDIQSGLNKFLDRRLLVPIVVVVFICGFLLYYSSSKSNVFDRMSTGDVGPQQPPQQPDRNPMESSPQTQGQSAGNYTSQQVAEPSDLLPKDSNSQWASLNPIGNGQVAMPDLLQAGYHIGLDTIGQTLKNANLQLRSDPIVEKKDVGPWNMSTYEPDYGGVPLELGACSK